MRQRNGLILSCVCSLLPSNIQIVRETERGEEGGRGSEGTREGRKREGEKKGGNTKAGEREGGRRGSIYGIYTVIYSAVNL